MTTTSIDSLGLLPTLPPLLTIAALSSYGLHLSYHNITRLQKYESASKKAAEWSNTAAERLHKTRTTQASAAISIGISLLASTVLLFLPVSRPQILVVGIAHCVIIEAARRHNATFWNDKTQVQVPFVTKFNEAIKGSEQSVRLMKLLVGAWAGSVVAWGVGWLLG